MIERRGNRPIFIAKKYSLPHNLLIKLEEIFVVLILVSMQTLSKWQANHII